MKAWIPRIFIIDDLFGRRLDGRPNRERANLCGMYGLRDVTGDNVTPTNEEVVNPIAEAVFFRGQRPLLAGIGDNVENDLEGTIEIVREGWVNSPRWALGLLDLCFYTGTVTKASNRSQQGMPEGRPGDDDPRQYFGVRILEKLNAEFPELPIIILSSKPRNEVSKLFAAHGALGFIPRTDSASPEKLRDYIWRHGLIPDESGGIVGNSLGLLKALRAARRAAGDRRNVLIRGERGAGKELLAAYLNRNAAGKNRVRPLVTVDSGTLSPSLYASELFGHVKGAFTGAERDRQGKIVQADGGDLFLDEIGNIPQDVQTGLLRILETRLVIPIGSNSAREVDVRFISATNEDIELKAASGGGFRPDLLDRMREGGTIILPSLRERREDIPLLAEAFIREAEASRQGALERLIAPEAMDELLSYNWPGNIRQLRSCVFKAVNDHPDVEHLVPGHLDLAKNFRPMPLRLSSPGSSESTGIPTDASGVSRLSNFISLFERVDVNPAEPQTWVGLWPALQRGYAALVLRVLRAALFATRRITPQNPEGEVKIHPAVKLLTGDPKVTASKAADILKRIYFAVPDSDRTAALEDPILKEAYDIALRLRPRKGKSSAGDKEHAFQ